MDALGISTATVVVLVLVAFAAGWVDAVVGGGGLLQLPALLIALPDSTPTASIGSALGAQIARFLPREVFTPIVLVALVVVGIYTWRRPELGLITERKHA